MASPTYFPSGYFGGLTSDEGAIVVSSTGGHRLQFVELYATRLDYELGTNDSAVLFTTARRKASVNEGLREFADLSECWQRESTITCSNGVATYNLHSTVTMPSLDFMRVTAEGPTYQYTDVSSNVTYLSGDDLPRRQEAWLNAAEPGWRVSTRRDVSQCLVSDRAGRGAQSGPVPAAHDCVQRGGQDDAALRGAAVQPGRRYQRAVYGRQRGHARRSAAVPSGAGALRGAQVGTVAEG